MFKALTRRANRAFKRLSQDGGAEPRLAYTFNRIQSEPRLDPHPNLIAAIGHADPLPDPITAASLRLADYPRNEIVAVCELCGRGSKFRTHRLIAEYGSTEAIAEVLAMKAEPCPASEAATCLLRPQTDVV